MCPAPVRVAAKRVGGPAVLLLPGLRLASVAAAGHASLPELALAAAEAGAGSSGGSSEEPGIPAPSAWAAAAVAYAGVARA